MRSLTIVVLLSFSFPLIAQQKNSFVSGSSDYFNNQELDYLNSLFTRCDIPMNLKGKRVSFLAGDIKTIVISKAEFFDQFITPYTAKGELPRFSVKCLDEQEQRKSGGFEILFTSHSADVTKRVYRELRELP